MTDELLRVILKREIEQGIGYLDDQIASDRETAMNYYYGEPFGDERDGRSKIVSTDVRDTIESIMPDMMEIFASGERAVEFKPVGPEDEEHAEQATDYVNHVWTKDNNGFLITHDWVKDALLQKTGVIKIYRDNSPQTKRESLTGLNSLALNELLADPNVKLEAHEEREASDEEIQASAPDGVVHDVTVVRTEQRGRTRIENVPPEEFIFPRNCRGLDDANFRFAAHWRRVPAGELVADGYPKAEIDAIPAYDGMDLSRGKLARFNKETQWPVESSLLDEAMREIDVYECYLRADYNGDGIPELIQVTVASNAYKILKRKGEPAVQEVSDHPFVDLCPVRVPHKFVGLSLADLILDIQQIKSTIERQLLDNLYLINNARSAVSSKVNLDDYLTNRPGGVVRVDSTDPVGNHVAPLPVQSIGPVVYQALEYFDMDRESRTGVTRNFQGLDQKALDQTATGINLMLGRAQRRMLGIARLFAETGFKQAFRKILKLEIENQDTARVVRLRNKWVPMDPRSWNAEMDVITNVGLGTGTKEQKVMVARMILETLEKIVAYQGGIQGPLVGLKEVREGVSALITASGEKNVDKYVMEPDPNWQPPQQPNPEMMKVQADIEGKKADIQLEREKAQVQAQIAMQKAQTDAEIAKAKLQQDAQGAAMTAAMDMKVMAFEQRLAVQKAEFEQMLAAQKAQNEAGRSAYEARSSVELAQVKFQTDAAMRRAEAVERGREDDKKERENEKKERAKERSEKREAKAPQVIVVPLPSGPRKLKIRRDAENNIVGAESEE